MRGGVNVSINLKMLGLKIKQLREESKLTQSQLADYLSVDQSLISKIEKGERSISSDMLDSLAALFCCSISDLIHEDVILPAYNIAFRTNKIDGNDLSVLATINKIALNQAKMDELAGGNINDR